MTVLWCGPDQVHGMLKFASWPLSSASRTQSLPVAGSPSRRCTAPYAFPGHPMPSRTARSTPRRMLMRPFLVRLDRHDEGDVVTKREKYRHSASAAPVRFVGSRELPAPVVREELAERIFLVVLHRGPPEGRERLEVRRYKAGLLDLRRMQALEPVV